VRIASVTMKMIPKVRYGAPLRANRSQPKPQPHTFGSSLALSSRASMYGPFGSADQDLLGTCEKLTLEVS
jgi:hypothetical protein